MDGTLGGAYNSAVDYYKETREKARQHSISSQQSLDKMLLTLIAGVFVLSVNVVFNKELDFVFSNLLIVTWVLLSIAIISQIISYVFTGLQTEDQLEKIDQWRDRWISNPLITRSDFKMPEKFNRQIKFANYTTITTFIISLLIILVFSIINFSYMYNGKKPVSQQSVEKAAESNLESYISPQAEQAKPGSPEVPKQTETEPASDTKVDGK